MATLFTETWTGTNGAAWPAQWAEGSTPVGGWATINGNVGQLGTGAQGSYAGAARVSRRQTGSYVDTDATLRFRRTVGESFLQVFARANTAVDTASGYAVDISPSAVTLRRYNNYGSVVLGTALNTAVPLNTWYRLRYRVVGSQIAFKLWADGATEPAAWDRDTTDTGITAAGSFGFSLAGGAAASSSVAEVDDVTVTDGVAADTIVPTAPAGVTAAANGPTQVTVAWAASTDNVGVVSYRVRRSGSDLPGAGAVTGTSFVDTDVTAGSSYSYTVSAVDAAGNRSAESAAAAVTIPTANGIRVWNGTSWASVNRKVWTGSGWLDTPGTGTGGGSGTATTLTTTVTAGDGQALLEWELTPGNDGIVPSHVHVGRDGNDTSGAGPWSTLDPLGALGVDGKYRGSRTFTKLTNGTAYNLHADIAVGGVPRNQRVTKSVTPASTGGGTPPPVTGRAVPLVGKSGMAWNSIVFGHGAQPGAFETWRKRPVDGVLYFPARQSWNDLKALPGRRAGDLMVYSIPPFPEGIGGSNGNVAAGSYDTQIRDFAQHLINAGWNTNLTVIRLGWENNGSWYQWGWDRGGVTNWINAYRRFVTQCRTQGLTGVRWNWCLNKGPQSYNSGYSWTTAYPGDEYVDVVGIDQYDHYSPSFTDAQWQSQILGKNPGLQDVADFVRSRGKMMSIDEWGVSHFSDGNGGGDNPFYVGKIFQFCQANADILAWDNTYDHAGAPASLKHKLSDGSNPNAAARYRQIYPNGWGG